MGLLLNREVIASNSMTSDKLSEYMDQFVAGSPDSVYIMVGINDLNYGSRSVDDIYNYEKTFIEELKSKLPDTEVYVLSVLPISKRFESSSKVKQTNIDALNSKFSDNAASLGITYVDVAVYLKMEQVIWGHLILIADIILRADIMHSCLMQLRE